MTPPARPDHARPTLEGLARDIVNALASGRTELVHARFDEAMREAMPPAALAGLWPSIEAQAGKLTALEGVRLEQRGELTAAIVTAACARIKLDVRVVFTVERRITGLFVQPANLDHAYRPPSYAHPAAYSEREVTVGSGKWALPGTLTLPAAPGKHPALVLVHGSGPNDRDETLGPNKPFRDLAHGLATRGVAVLRYDKRTLVHAQALVAELGAALTLREETIDDALAAAALLRTEPRIDAGKIFVLGHSLGGTAIPRIAEADPRLAGFVILAGSTLPLPDTVLRQTRYIAELGGAVSDAERQAIAELEAQVERVKALSRGEDVEPGELLLGAGPAYWRDLAGYDPAARIAAEQRPILVLQGDRDYQVTLDDYAGWERALGARSNATLKRYAALNHLFVAGHGKSTPSEYQQPGNVAAEVIADIAAFVQR